MRRILLLLCAIALSLPTARLFAGGGGDEGGDETLRRSDDNLGSYPGGPVTKSPLSTGYYITDNDAPLSGAPWTPSFSKIDTTGTEANTWRRILSGPGQRPSSIWTAPGSLGYEYFRNPNAPTDSTDNAFAGPIAIGFPFYYYGKKYDSFYVSTNGLIALSNRRYIYADDGTRIGYEPQRDDPRSTYPTGAANDTMPDDYGYKVVALGSNPTAATYNTSKTAGILSPANAKLPVSSLKSILAPLWTDTELSQYDATTGLPDDFGRVYWRRDPSGNRMHVYFVNQSMIGLKNIPIINQVQSVAKRQIRAEYQVVLDRSDSSVQYNYISFVGEYKDQNQQVIRIPSNAMYRANSTIGIQSHDQEYTNYLYNADFQGAVYVNGIPTTPPKPSLAIRFKQWKNIVRVVSVTFQTPKRGDTGWVDLPKGTQADNYELLLGDPTLGVVRPIGIVQNVSSDVGPVNITQQPIQFNVIFRIRDLVNVNANPPYQKTNVTRSLYPIYQEPARTSKDTIIFLPYFTNASLVNQLGRFKAEVLATDQNPNGQSYGQQWPFDDTTGVRLFGIRRQNLPYINVFDDYDNSPEDGVIPSVKRWVSIGAEVVDGDALTWNPPPPRGPQGILGYNSPVCKLDRRDNGKAFYNLDQVGVVGGDTLISFPINLASAQTQPVLVLAYERAGKNTYDRGWSDLVRVGPEHAVYNTLKSTYLAGGTPDMMLVEFAEPSPNGLDNITNVKNWRDANFNDNAGLIKWPGPGSPRWGVLGGGGSSFDITANPQADNTTGKLIVNEFDAGKDFEFNRAYIPIPSRWTSNVNANKTFRFRIRVAAKSDKNPVGPPADDEDAFYVDNVMVIEPDKPELEVTSVGYNWPYTEAPASQARAIPLYARVSNNGSTAATAFGLSLYVENKTTPPPVGQYSYYRYQTVLSLGAGQTTKENFPAWNAQECGTAITPGPNAPLTVSTTYRITGELQRGIDSYNANDKTYTDFTLTLGPTFAYDDGGSDVQQFSSVSGKGLNLTPTSNQDYQAAEQFGPNGGSTSGSFAAQFTILTRDTIRGYKAYYGGANQSPDLVLYQIYKQPSTASLNAAPAAQGLVTATKRYAHRGEGIPDVPTGDPYNFDKYVTFLLDTPYVCDPGTYFVSVSQLAQTGLELGGDASRQGQVTTIRFDGPGTPGVANYSVPAHVEMRQNRFWYETTANSGTWNPMLTTVGNPGFPHLTWQGLAAPPAAAPQIPTNTRGSWIPMIRPYFGSKASGSCTVEPVELSKFDVSALSTALRLDWTTSSETNNHGFYIERRVKGESEWNQNLGFVAGAGSSNQTHNYNYVDDRVVANTTYQYRLRQEDRDGSVNYSSIKEGRLNGASTGAAVNSLSQNTPNPFNATTKIGFTVAESGAVNLEIVDIYGKVVRAFTLDARAGEANSVTWDGQDASGVQVPNGVYVYKLNGNGFTLSNKLTVTR